MLNIFASKRTFLLFGFLVSASLLIGAYGFEILGGLEPCTLCLYQRIPHVLIVLIAGLSLVITHGSKKAPALLSWALIVISVIFLLSTVLAFYHIGVEQKWWISIFPCSAGPISTQGLSSAEILEQLSQVKFVRCDSPAWRLFGISMAGYNMLISGFVFLLSLRAICKS